MYVDQHVHGYAELLLPEWLYFKRHELHGCQYVLGRADLFVPGRVYPVGLYLQSDVVSARDGNADLPKWLHSGERDVLDADDLCRDFDFNLSWWVDFAGWPVSAEFLLYGERHLYLPGEFSPRRDDVSYQCLSVRRRIHHDAMDDIQWARSLCSS